uniref:Membrane fusion protein (MFP) family protein n=1 Tax=Serratia marcescens TaxID=615 RepID=Q57387_SERMA|nr:protease SM transporter [Serratia marcescens]CAA57067.1 hasE [Serratia marcescens]
MSNQSVIPGDIDTLSRQFDEGRHLRLGGWLVLLGFGGFLLWGLLAPLDKGVPVSGSVVVAGNRKAVQHPSGGVVSQIQVHEGDRVRAGQVLLLMDTVDSRTQRDALRSQHLSNAAQQARLQAERDGLQAIAFPPLLQARREEPEVMSLMLLQQQLFTSRRAALQSELAAIAESIAGSQAMLEGVRRILRPAKQRQKAMLQEQLSGMRNWPAQGMWRASAVGSEGQHRISTQASRIPDIGRLGRQSELKLRSPAREYQKEVSSQLPRYDEADELDNRLAKAEADLGHTQVKAPVAGTVVGLSVFTEGGVIGAGQQLMEIVPSDRGLQVEARIPVELIDKVQVGLPVELLFSAFNQSTTPRVEGEVTLVGADRLTDEKSGAPYYSVRAKVSEEGLQRLNGLEIRPGMPVEGFIRTGERSMMNYLFKPLTDRLHLALTEE